MKRLLLAVILLALWITPSLAARCGQATEVMLLNFPDDLGEDCTPAYAGAAVFTDYANWLQTESNGIEYLTGSYPTNVHGWLTLPQNYSYYCPGGVCSTLLFEPDAKALSVGLFDWDKQDLIILFIRNEGGGKAAAPAVYTYCAQTFPGTNPNLAILVHEGGHAQPERLGHSGSWTCADGRDVGPDLTNPASSGCSVLSGGYGDYSDPMGGASNDIATLATQHYSTYLRNRLLWMSPANIKTVTTSQNVTITRADTYSPTAVQDVRIPLTGGYVYTLEYRPYAPIQGVLIRVANTANTLPFSGYAAETLLVNGPYGSSAITASNPFNDTYRNITVTLVSANGTTATVAITK